MFLTVGQTIKLNRTIEIEHDNGWTALIEAGTEVTVRTIWHGNHDGSLNVDINAEDVPYLHPLDRSGQSDTEITLTHNLDIAPDDID